MACPNCALRQENDDLKSEREAERIDLGLCWIEGGILNHEATPTVVRIDGPISYKHSRELVALLNKIERGNAKTGD